MDTVEICRKLEKCTYNVNVYDGEERYSSGSAYCIRSDGTLMTAAHVITGRLPLRREDWKDPNVVIKARTVTGQFRGYRPVLCGIRIEWPNILKKEIQIDLALLSPLETVFSTPFLRVSKELCPVGTKVLMAGFPDELELPLQWDQALDYDYEAFRSKLDETQRGLDQLRELLMVKSGMIAHTNNLVMDPDGTGKRALQLGAYYIDNAMHSGASGGPVVNENAEVIGTITKRAVTVVPFPD